MAKAIWTGSLSFGLVNVPVGLYSATEDRSIHFNQFRAGTPERIRNKRVGEQSGEEVAYSDIVKGYDLGGGEYVILTPEELASVAPGPSRTIEVTDFVELAQIDPVYFDKPYFLAPQGKSGDRAYELLRRVMAETNKVAIGNFVMRDKEYLVAVRPEQSALVLETLLFADEVRDPVKEIDGLPVQASFEPRELDTAKLLLDSMTTTWDPQRYHDTHRERVEELIEQKRQGTLVISEAPRAEPAPVVNLLAALQASVKAARARSATPGASSGSTRQAQERPRQRTATPKAPGQKVAGPKAAPAQKAAAEDAPAQKAAAEDAPAQKAAAAEKAAAENAAGQSRTELLRRAGDLGIAGRSKMSREQLEQAVADASGARRQKAS